MTPKAKITLISEAQLVVCCPTKWKFAGLIPGQGTCLGGGFCSSCRILKMQPINVLDFIKIFFYIKNFLMKRSLYFFQRFYLFIYKEREGRKKERERNVNVWLPLTCSPLGTWPTTQGMCPDWESNQWPFGLQTGTQSSDSHQPGCNILKKPKIYYWY